MRTVLGAWVGALIVCGALVGCKFDGASGKSTVIRYGDKELVVSGAAVISDGTKAWSAADESSPVVDEVPPGTPVEKVAEKDDFVLVKWKENDEPKEGWVPKQKAESTPDLAPRVESSENEVKAAAEDTRRLRLPTAAPEPPKPAGWAADPPKEIAEEKPTGWKNDPPKEVAEEKPTGWKPKEEPPKEVAPEKPTGWKPKEEPPKEVKPSGWKSDPPKEVAPEKPTGWKPAEEPPKEVAEEKPPAKKW